MRHADDILRDVSLRKQTEEALIQSEKLASVGRDTAMIAHEINNPLTAIQNVLYMLENDIARGERQMYLSLAETEVRRAIQIAQNTLGLSRPSISAEEFRIAEAVEGVVLLLDRKQREIAIETRCPPHNMEIVAVQGEIKRVLWNLLTNAIDAVPAKTGNIKVRVSRSHLSNGSWRARITVADNAVGMDVNTLRRMLETFYTTKSNGTGLGMWISNEIIYRHPALGMVACPSLLSVASMSSRSSTLYILVKVKIIAARFFSHRQPVLSGFPSIGTAASVRLSAPAVRAGEDPVAR